MTVGATGSIGIPGGGCVPFSGKRMPRNRLVIGTSTNKKTSNGICCVPNAWLKLRNLHRRKTVAAVRARNPSHPIKPCGGSRYGEAEINVNTGAIQDLIARAVPYYPLRL
jgi:hypothetical protein